MPICMNDITERCRKMEGMINIAIALIGFLGTIFVGAMSLVGVILSNRKQHALTVEEIKGQVTQLDQKVGLQVDSIKKDINNLEIKQDKHNSVIERMFCAEKSIELLDERVKVANHRIDDLERTKEDKRN